MRAALLREVPGELEIDEVEVSAPGPARGARPHRGGGLLPLRPPLHGGQVPVPHAGVLGHESAGVVEAVGRGRHLRAARRPRDHLPVGVLRPLRGLPHRPPVPVPGQGRHRGAARHRAAAPHPRRREASPVPRPGSSFAEQMLVHEHGDREDPRGHAARPGGAHRLRRHHRRRRRVQHRQGGARLRRSRSSAAAASASTASRAPRIAGAGQVIAVDMLDVEARAGPGSSAPPTSSTPAGDPVGQVGDLDRRRRRLRLRGHRPEADRRAGLRHARRGGTGTVIGMIPVGQSVEIPGYDFLQREAAPWARTWARTASASTCPLRRPLPRRRLKLDELVSRRIGARRGQRRVRRHEGGPGRRCAPSWGSFPGAVGPAAGTSGAGRGCRRSRRRAAPWPPGRR